MQQAETLEIFKTKEPEIPRERELTSQKQENPIIINVLDVQKTKKKRKRAQ